MKLAFAVLLVLQQANPFDKYDGATPPVVPWELEWPEGAYWYGFTDDLDQYWVMPTDITRDSLSGTRTVWLRGRHELNEKVPYRRSLWRVRFDCRGGTTLTATTTFTADGETNQWDGLGQYQAIRPDTIYESLENRLCSP